MGDNTKDKKIRTIPAKFNGSQPRPATTAPMIPPTRACEELLGMAYHQVSRFQMMAPISADVITCWSTMEADLTISPPMVLATPVLNNAPAKFKAEAIQSACFGVRARVEMEVAMALAVS